MENYKIIKKIYSTNSEDRVVLLVEKDGQQYAMKRLNLEDDLQKQEVIFNEVKVLENLVHPNIIKCHETFQYEQKLCIVMEYAEGGDLKRQVLVKQQSKEFFDENQIWNMFAQLCLAVKYLHDSKILHRDLKILNVFISKNGLLKLGDFGVSKQLDNQDILTNTHVGTPYYMSPEQCSSNSYNHKVDIWMLGCLLYELCTLEKPFKSDNLIGLIKQITQNDPNPIPDHYSNTMNQLVQVMMSKEPEIFPNPKKMTGFLRIKQKPTLSNKAFIPDEKKKLGVIGELKENSQQSFQSNDNDQSNSLVSSDFSSQQNQQQQNVDSSASPENMQTLDQNNLKQQMAQGKLNINTVQNEMDEVIVSDSNNQDKKQSSENIKQGNAELKEFQDETFGISKPLDDFVIQIPQTHHQQNGNQQQKKNINSHLYNFNNQNQYFQQHLQQNIHNFQAIGQQLNSNQQYHANYPFSPNLQYIQNQYSSPNQQYAQQYKLNQQFNPNLQLHQQYIQNQPYPSPNQQYASNQQFPSPNQQYPSPNQYQMLNLFLGNKSQHSQCENVSPINSNIHQPLTQQMSQQQNHLSNSQFGFQSGYIPSATNSNNSSMVMDLRSPNTQNSMPQQNLSELSSPVNMPFSPINQYEPYTNHYQTPYSSQFQQQIAMSSSTPSSNQQQNKKQPVKIPRYKPPIVIDTAISGNFSQKKSTPNSDVQTNQNGSSGNGCGLGSGRSGSAQNSQKNSTLSSRIFMMIDDENQGGVTLSQCGSSKNHSCSSNTTSNQSSTKNNSTKNNSTKNNSTKNQSTCTNNLQQDSHNLPTTKVKPKYFNFPPDRTQFSNFLKQQISEERFNKMKSILDNSSNPLKILESNPQLVAEIIGEENMKLVYAFRYIISPQVTPQGSNHLRHKSFQGFENPFQNQDSILKNSGVSNSLHHSQNQQMQSQQQQLQFQQQHQQQQQMMANNHSNYVQNHYQQSQIGNHQQQPYNPTMNSSQINNHQQNQNVFSPQQMINKNYYLQQQQHQLQQLQQQQFIQQNNPNHHSQQNNQYNNQINQTMDQPLIANDQDSKKNNQIKQQLQKPN